MTTVRIKGFKIFKDRHGRMRCYHREIGQKIDLVKAPLGSAAFFTECEKITAIAEANKAKAPKVGTLGGLIQSYYETEHFKISPQRRGATTGSARTFLNLSATRPSTPSTRPLWRAFMTRPP